MKNASTDRLTSLLKELHLKEISEIYEAEAEKAAKTKLSFIGYLSNLLIMSKNSSIIYHLQDKRKDRSHPVV